MFQVVFFVLAVLLANVGGHADCVAITTTCPAGMNCSGGCGPKFCENPNSGYSCLDEDYYKGYEFVRTFGAYKYCKTTRARMGAYCSEIVFDADCCAEPFSSSSSTPNSSSSSSSPIGPPLGGGCGFCQDTVDYSEFPPQVKHVVWHCDSCTAGRDGIANEAAGCAIESIGLGSCEDNNECPSGVICMDDSTFNYDCYATVGATVYVRNRKNGNVFSCEADGSCDMALKKVASGECIDPSQPPENPNNPSSSGSGESSSSDDPNNPSSSDDTCDMCDKLGKIVANTQVTAENTGDIANYTQETMNKAIDIYNQQTEMQIDLSHVRTNTENTATNTGNIDTKLSTTNNLLNDIKNKNWSPQIHVGSPEVSVEVQGDTNIITVQGDTNIINVDTSRSPFEILQFLKEIFSGDTASGINPNDTVGTADSVNSLLSALFGDSLNQYNGDSLSVARDGYGAAFRAYKDTLNGIMRDSLNAWNNTLLNNGVLSGDGSNDCPSFLMQTKSLAFGSLFTVQLPALGGVLCNPIPHTSITFWGLARTLLRMLVAIACMWWIYHAVIGSRGNDED